MMGLEGETTRMRLSGYVAPCDHGFTLPVYTEAAPESANAWYAAITEVEGDRHSTVRDFTICDISQIVPFRTGIEISQGDLWHDVFLWEGNVFVGTTAHVYARLRPFHSEILRTAPLTYLDLTIGAKAPDVRESAKAALRYLREKLGDRQGTSAFCDSVLAPEILLALHRQSALRDGGAALIRTNFREFSVAMDREE